nr:MAG TPA: hypothetical protein [Caudoviricetes sp.]
MSEVSKIELPDGSLYDLKDEELRRMIEVLLGKQENG